MTEVYGIIRKLGATSKYKGYYYVADAVEMAQGIHERPVKVTKDTRSLRENINQHLLM
jgi:two-component system response regulator (stage 0 sporulation protein A)